MLDADRLKIDRGFVSRLLLGALGEHEQRLLVVRTLLHDPSFRSEILAELGPFRAFDDDLMAEYAAALIMDSAAEARGPLLERARERAEDLDELVREFTFGDVLRLGPVTQRLFSWAMAEHLLERCRSSGRSRYERQTSLYLALMVIDVLDILGAAGRVAHFPGVVADVRRRIARARAELQAEDGTT